MATTGSWAGNDTVTRTNIWGTQTYTLSQNEVFGSLFNLLISARTFTDNINGGYTSLCDRFRTDGSQYGDFKTYKGTDVLKTQAFTDGYAYNSNGNFQGNLLKTAKPADPKVQYVQIDQVRFIELSLDTFLTKRAFSDEGSFSEFHGSMLSWLGDTKKVYESSLVNAWLGTSFSNSTINTIEIDLPTVKALGTTEEEKRRLSAQQIAKDTADLLVEIKDFSRDYNEWGLLRAVNPDDLLFVWNAKYINEITKLDLPTIFHKDGLMEKMDQEILPKRWFGRAAAATDKGAGALIDADGVYDNTKGTLRSLVEKEYTVGQDTYHVFPGDALVDNATVKSSGGNFTEAEVYVEDPSIIAKIVHKSGIVYMAAYESQESFYNPRGKITNFYLHFSYSNPCYLKNYPFLTVKEKAATVTPTPGDND